MFTIRILAQNIYDFEVDEDERLGEILKELCGDAIETYKNQNIIVHQVIKQDENRYTAILYAVEAN